MTELAVDVKNSAVNSFFIRIDFLYMKEYNCFTTNWEDLYMAAQVYTFKVIYEGCNNKIWRTFEVSSNYDFARLGYMILSSFDTKAYHLFSIEHKDIVYETAIENYGESPLLQDIKLSNLNLQPSEHMEMIYDYGTEQHFDIEFISAVDMLRGKGTSYPKVIDGAGRGIIDDMHVDELMEIIAAIDKNGKSDFKVWVSENHEIIWDYRDYNIKYDNALLKGKISLIQEGYEGSV